MTDRLLTAIDRACLMEERVTLTLGLYGEKSLSGEYSTGLIVLKANGARIDALAVKAEDVGLKFTGER